MDELIRRGDAVAVFGDVHPLDYNAQACLSQIREIPAVDTWPMPWIDAEKEKPETYVEVLCYYEYFRYGDYNCMVERMDVGSWSEYGWGGDGLLGDKVKVLYWTPLPPVPKEKEG